MLKPSQLTTRELLDQLTTVAQRLAAGQTTPTNVTDARIIIDLTNEIYTRLYPKTGPRTHVVKDED